MQGLLVVLIFFITSPFSNGFTTLFQQRIVTSRQELMGHYRNPAFSRMDTSPNIVGASCNQVIVFSQPNFQDESKEIELVDVDEYEMSDEMLSDIDSYSPGNWEIMKQVKSHNQLYAIDPIYLFINLLSNYKIKHLCF